jgi:VanZ family protein
MLSVEMSLKISSAVGGFLRRFLGGGGDPNVVGGMSIRKMAHFVEFCALGVVSVLLVNFCTHNFRTSVYPLALLGFFVPFVDETIQIFSGRGPAIRDVWIDIGGYALGCILSFLSLYLLTRLAKKEKNQL